MDSYEKLRRMNELAKELKTRGFADSTIDAIKQAQEIYGSEDEVINKNTTDPQQTSTFTDKDTAVPQFDQFSHVLKANEAFKKSMTEQMDALTNDMHAVIEKVNEIVKKINELESKIAGIKGMTLSEHRPEPRPEAQQEPPQEQKKDAPAEEKPADPKQPYNQRIGAFTEDDVSIEKMFYMGKR
ncbi:MAG: hypothetical protein V1725_06935 [archaeon]